MSDLLEVLRARRSIRRYSEHPVPSQVIDQLLTAAIWAPSAHNRQPWRFAVTTSPDMRARLATAMGERLRQDLATDGAPVELIEKDVARSWARITGAPVLFVLCLTMEEMDHYPDPRRQRNEEIMAIQSTAMAGQNLLLAAHALGLAACWLCAPLFCAGTVRAVLELPDDWQPQGMVTVGYAAETREKSRQPLPTRVVYR